MDRLQVVLSEDCLRHGGNEEYPNGWKGVEAIPPAMKDGLEEKKAIKAYQASAPVVREGLRYVRFGKPFMGKNERGQPQKKTDQNNGMWVPGWLLRPAEKVASA